MYKLSEFSIILTISFFFFTDVTDWFIGNDFLPNPMFPIIFDQMKGSCKPNESSFVNMEEADAVVGYIVRLSRVMLKNGHQLTQQDIGVVTPYSKQVQLIRDECSKKGFSEIMIGSAEVFQGQEKPIMIISTVRTDGLIGFVNNPRVRSKFNFKKLFSNFFNVCLLIAAIKRDGYQSQMPSHRDCRS